MVRILSLTLFSCFALFFIAMAGVGEAGEIPMDLARHVAENTLDYHVSLYGHWSGGDTAQVKSGEAIRFRDTLVAYNFRVVPSGHVLVAAHDEFSPVLLYSVVSDFNADRITIPGTVESWVIKEIYQSLGDVNREALSVGSGLRALQTNTVEDRITRSWGVFGSDATDFRSDNSSRAVVNIKSDKFAQTVGPLLSSSWSQSYPYNALIPADNGCSNALTGCVATAFSQLLNYWEWPPKGEGSHSYTWRPSSGSEQILNADFAHPYNWDLMPDRLDIGSTDAQIQSVARLMADMGVAVETIFGCSSSGSYAYADDVLDLYFRYKSSMKQNARSNHTADQWFEMIKAELDADPPRPVVLSIFLADFNGGHETILDGYQAGITDKVHINFGWSGAYNGYYDITHNFSTGNLIWGASFQVAVTGIEPLNTAPSADAGADKTAASGETVVLSGSGIDPDGAAIAGYQWTQIQGPAVKLTGAFSSSLSFAMPQVDADTALVFRLRVTDSLGAVAEDTCAITLSSDGSGGAVQDTSSSGSAGDDSQNSSGSGGGGGPCFIGTLFF